MILALARKNHERDTSGEVRAKDLGFTSSVLARQRKDRRRHAVKRQAFFLGCVIPLRFPGIEVAARRVFGRLGIECVDLDGYSCCPEPVVLGLADQELPLAVSARNLALAEAAEADLLVLCNGCYESLAEADHTLQHDEGMRSRVGKILAGIGRQYEGKIRIRHFIDFLHEEVGVERIRAACTTPVQVSVACHYGCHLFREPGGQDVWRKPTMMKRLVEAAGACVTEYGLEQLCCGFPVAQFDKRAAIQERLLPKVKALGGTCAEAVIFCCPACLNQFETGQGELGDEVDRYPCVHLLELLALAFGASPAELHLEQRLGATKEFAECFWG
jgi:heterodisulfide reductase subunit B